MVELGQGVSSESPVLPLLFIIVLEVIDSTYEARTNTGIRKEDLKSQMA